MSTVMEVDDEFRTFLESLGYSIYVVGDPLDNVYKALSIGVYGTPAKYRQVMEEIGNYVAVHEDEFAYVTLEDGSRVRNPKVQQLIPHDSWENKRALAAASLLYEVNLVVITDEELFFQYPDAGGYERCVTLSYEEDMVFFSFNVLTQHPAEVVDEYA